MTSTRKLVSALCLALCFSGYSNAEPTTQTHSISDDGFANVPLQFGFPFYGQTFTNSWMFSNGLISFQDPDQSGLAWSNLSVQNFSTMMGNQFNYSIFPLWTDLINIIGSFTSEGSAEFQRYNWISISPFYDSNRLNTFSVEIRPDGEVITNYSLINVDYGIVGLVGDASRSEFEQLYSHPGSITDWSRYTYSSSIQDPGADSGSSPPAVTVTPIMEITQSNTGIEVSLIEQPQVLETAQTSDRPVPTAPSASGISVSRILNSIAREQARIGLLERATVSASIDAALVQGQQSVDQAEAVAAAAQIDGQATSISSQQRENNNESISPSSTATPGLSNANADHSGITAASATGEDRNQSLTVAGFAAVDILRSDDVSVQETAPGSRGPDTVKQGAPDNDLAGGVTLASLGAPPLGFQTYQVMMPDSRFYEPREIYPGQQTVDNRRALRALGADRLFQDMVDQQYRR